MSYPVAAVRGRASAPAAGAAWSPLDAFAFWLSFRDPTSLFTDTDGTTPVASDGDSIKNANDLIGSLDVSEGTNPPTYKTNILDGQSVARFNGSSSKLARGSTLLSALVGTNAGTIIAVMYHTATANNCALWLPAPNGGNSLGMFIPYSGNVYFPFGNNVGGGQIDGTVPGGFSDAWHIVVFHRNGGPGKIYVDGGAAVISGTFTDDLDNTASGTLNIGTDGTVFQGGDIADIFVADTGLDAATLNQFGAWMTAECPSLSWSDIS